MIMEYWDDQLKKSVPVSPSTPMPMGSAAPTPGSITSDMIADGAVTDDKLAKPKVDLPAGMTAAKVIGTSLSTNTIEMVGYSQDPLADNLAMYNFGGQIKTAAPVEDNDAATKKYVDDKQVTADKISDASTVGRSVLKAADQAAARTAIGAGTSSQNLTALLAAEATTGTATTARAITAAVLAGAINERTKGKAEIAALTPIADPSTADAPAVAALLNDVIAALKA